MGHRDFSSVEQSQCCSSAQCSGSSSMVTAADCHIVCSIHAARCCGVFVPSAAAALLPSLPDRPAAAAAVADLQAASARALFKQTAGAICKAPAIPSFDRHRSAALRYLANVLGSRFLTLWPRSVAMGRGRASSGAHHSSTLARGGPSSSCVIETQLNNRMATSTTAAAAHPPPPALFFCRRTQPLDA